MFASVQTASEMNLFWCRFLCVSPPFDDIVMKGIVWVGMQVPNAIWDNFPVRMKTSTKCILNL